MDGIVLRALALQPAGESFSLLSLKWGSLASSLLGVQRISHWQLLWCLGLSAEAARSSRHFLTLSTNHHLFSASVPPLFASVCPPTETIPRAASPVFLPEPGNPTLFPLVFKCSPEPYRCVSMAEAAAPLRDAGFHGEQSPAWRSSSLSAPHCLKSMLSKGAHRQGGVSVCLCHSEALVVRGPHSQCSLIPSFNSSETFQNKISFETESH